MCCFLHSALPVPVVTISFSGSSTAGEEYSLQCSASVVAGLVVLPDLKIVFPNSTEISVMDSSSLDYMFSPLRTSDGGQYTCTATVNISQAGIMDLQNSAVETVVVVGKQPTDGHLHVHVQLVIGTYAYMTCNAHTPGHSSTAGGLVLAELRPAQ